MRLVKIYRSTSKSVEVMSKNVEVLLMSKNVEVRQSHVEKCGSLLKCGRKCRNVEDIEKC